MSVWNSRRQRRQLAVMVSGVLAGTAGCVNDKGTAPKQGMVSVRAINVSPNAGSLDLVLNRTIAVAAEPFLGDASMAVRSGGYALAFDSAGTSLAVLSMPTQFSDGTSYDLIVAGTVGGSSPTVQLLGGTNPPPTVDLTTVAAVRLFNAVADTGHRFGDSVSVYFTDSTGRITNAKLSYPNLHPFATAAANGNGSPIYFAVEPGLYHIIVASPIDSTIAADSTVVFTAGQVRTVIAAPSKNQASGNILIVPDAS